MYALFDVGGSKIRVAFSKDGTELGEPKVIPTHADDFEKGVRQLGETIQELAGKAKIEAVAGGVAGPFNKERTGLVGGRTLPDWTGKPLKKELERLVSAPVSLENDADLAGLGETTYGAGKGYDIVVYMTVSTGVGGTRIVQGNIDVSTMGFEPGKQIIDKGRTLEELVSGSDMEKQSGKKPYEIPQDDPIWEELAVWLAVGLNNTIVHWSPDIVVLGGSMMTGNPSIPLEGVKRHLKKTLTIFPQPPELALAELGDFGGLWGALELVKNNSRD